MLINNVDVIRVEEYVIHVLIYDVHGVQHIESIVNSSLDILKVYFLTAKL